MEEGGVEAVIHTHILLVHKRVFNRVHGTVVIT